MKLGVEIFFFKIPYCRTIFNFSCKTSGFCGAGCFFGGTFLSFFGHFFIHNLSFLRGWVVFLSEKDNFFSCKTSVFAGLGSLFGTFFWHFFVIFSCRNSVFWEAGRSLLVKNDIFFRAKLQFLRGWVVFLSRKNGIFLRFFRKCRRRPSVGEPGGPKRAKREC